MCTPRGVGTFKSKHRKFARRIAAPYKFRVELGLGLGLGLVLPTGAVRTSAILASSQRLGFLSSYMSGQTGKAHDSTSHPSRGEGAK